MSSSQTFNTKSPTIRRILREAAELSSSPSPDYAASPLDANLFEWHFTLRGPPAPSPFASGIYHGRIVLPPTYPLRPPSFRFLTPSGRFEVNREICLSISGFHEETWQPAWGLRTAMVALRAFMEEGGAGQVGGLESSEGVRRALARESRAWRCAGCGGRSNEEVLKEQEELARRMEEEGEGGKGKREEDVVPRELKLGYREEIERSSKKEKDGDGAGGDVVIETKTMDAKTGAVAATTLPSPSSSSSSLSTETPNPTPTPTQQPLQREQHDNDNEPIPSRAPPAPHPQPATLPPAQTTFPQIPATALTQQTQTQTPARPTTTTTTTTAMSISPSSTSTSWVDYAIIGIVVALVIMVMKKMLLSFDGYSPSR